MIKNGVEIVKFSEEETNKIFAKKAEMEEKKKNKKLKKNKYKSNTNIYKNDYNNNSRENFIFHKRGANNFVKRGKGHFYQRTNYRDFENYDYYEYDYDNNTFNEYKDRRGYQNFHERGRPNPIFRGNRGKRGRMNY